MEPTIKLGDYARDTVTGYEGTVVARTEWLNGCWRLTLQGRIEKGSKQKPDEAFAFDAPQCELIERKNHLAEKKTGGPRPNVPRTGLRG